MSAFDPCPPVVLRSVLGYGSELILPSQGRVEWWFLSATALATFECSSCHSLLQRASLSEKLSK